MSKKNKVKVAPVGASAPITVTTNQGTVPTTQTAPAAHQHASSDFSITETIAQQDKIVTSSATYEGKELDATLKTAIKTASKTEKTSTTLAGAKRKGLARHFNLDRATDLATAGLEVQGFTADILTLEGWHHRLCVKRAAEHAANSYALYLDTLLPHKLRHEILSMTLARCVDYGKTPKEAADLIRKAVEKRMTRYGAETRYSDMITSGL